MSKLTKRVSNYELFFDLTFVLAIGQLTSAIHIEHVGIRELLAFYIGNLTLLSIWANETLYYNRYGDSRIADIYTVIALMFIVGNMALNFNFDPSGWSNHIQTDLIFNCLLIAAYLVIALQYFLKGKKLGFKSDIKVSIIQNIIYALAIIPLTIPSNYGNLWLGLLYLTPLIFPFFTAKHHKDIKINFPHIVERTQLITILTFGEAVIAIITTYPLSKHILQGALLFWGMAMLFMFYMIQSFLAVNHHSKKDSALYIYAHIPIFLGINSFTVGLEFLADHHHAPTGYYLFAFGILSIYFGSLITSAYNHSFYRLTLKDYLYFTIILLAMLISFWISGPHIFQLSIILIVTTWFMRQYYRRTRKRLREKHQIPHPDTSQNLRDFS